MSENLEGMIIKPKRKISLLSIISFVILILPFVFMPLTSRIFPTKQFSPNQPTDWSRLLLGSATLLCFFSSFILSIVDLFLKNRRKVLSIITISISSFFVLIILITFLSIF